MNLRDGVPVCRRVGQVVVESASDGVIEDCKRGRAVSGRMHAVFEGKWRPRTEDPARPRHTLDDALHLRVVVTLDPVLVDELGLAAGLPALDELHPGRVERGLLGGRERADVDERDADGLHLEVAGGRAGRIGVEVEDGLGGLRDHEVEVGV